MFQRRTLWVALDKVYVSFYPTLTTRGGWLLAQALALNDWLWRSVSSTRIYVSLTAIIDGSTRWTNQRIAFGKPLNSQAVIRARLASMIERAEACQSWVENITYQMNHVRLR